MPKLKDTRDPLELLLRTYGSVSELASAAGFSYATGSRKIKSPEDLTIGELRRIQRRLHIPVDELRGKIV